MWFTGTRRSNQRSFECRLFFRSMRRKYQTQKVNIVSHPLINMQTTSTPPSYVLGALDARLPKTAQVYELLRDAIIVMKLPPGVPIVEKEICEQLDISRTPLREAILQLAVEGLVIVKPGGGTYVNLIEGDQVLQGQVVRDTLETRLVRLAAREFREDRTADFELSLFQQRAAQERGDIDAFFRLDNAFHKLVCQCTSYPNSWRIIHGATGQLDRIRRFALPKENHLHRSFAEHGRIFECIRHNDEEGAVQAFQGHIDRIFEDVDLVRTLSPEWMSHHTEITLDHIR